MFAVALYARAWVEIIMGERRKKNYIGSPSTRRAWVEIFLEWRQYRVEHLSPSTRRAWVEILSYPHPDARPSVALYAEGVGRNLQKSTLAEHLRIVALYAEGVGRNMSGFFVMCP